MHIRVLSDLHLGFGPVELPDAACDLVVLAGDIHVRLNGVRWIRERFPGVPALYVAGNHEYYGEKLPRLLDKIREEARGTDIHLLENESVEIGGYRFFGATLWTDMELHGPSRPGEDEAGQRMNDYKRIRRTPSYRKLRPVETRAAHRETVAALDRFLREGTRAGPWSSPTTPPPPAPCRSTAARSSSAAPTPRAWTPS